MKIGVKDLSDEKDNYAFLTGNGYMGRHHKGISSIDGIIIANKTFSVPKKYGRELTGEAFEAFEKMQSDAADDGVNIYIKSDYRPYKDQKYGYVVDFADIEEEYEKTNGQYQKELEAETGKDWVDGGNKLFVSEDEAQEQIAGAIETVEPYDMQSPTVFSKQINMENDTALLNKLLNALNVILTTHNMLLTQGSNIDEIRNAFENKCNFYELRNFIKALKLRIASVNFAKHGDEAASAREMLNVALEDLTFTFEQNGDAKILELEGQYKQSVAYVREQLLSNSDNDDPEYKALEQAFLDEVTKHGMGNLNDPDSINKLNMHDRVDAINDILARIRRKNEEDNILAA